MKHILLFEELTGIYKKETKILYKNKDMVCLIPKSQMTSNIYSIGTNWCSQSNSGFNLNVREGFLLFRFLFKNGRKLRLTYNIINKPHIHKFKEMPKYSYSINNFQKYHWSNEIGGHYKENHIENNGDNPFIISKKDMDRLEYPGLDTENLIDTINLIKSIPQECKDRVLEFIKKGKNIKYRIRKQEYKPPQILSNIEKWESLKKRWENKLNKIRDKNKYLFINYNKINKKFEIRHNKLEKYDYNKLKEETFKNISDFEKRLEQLYNEYKNSN